MSKVFSHRLIGVLRAVQTALLNLGWTGTKLGCPSNDRGFFVGPTGNTSGEWIGLFHDSIKTGAVALFSANLSEAEILRSVRKHVSFEPLVAVGGIEVGRYATMSRCTAVGVVVGLYYDSDKLRVILEFLEPQPVDWPPETLSRRFDLTATNVTSTWLPGVRQDARASSDAQDGPPDGAPDGAPVVAPDASPLTASRRISKKWRTSNLEFTDIEMARYKARGQLTQAGVAYHEELAGPGGMSFILLREPGTTEEMLLASERQLRRDRDVVGEIRVACVASAGSLVR